MRRNLLILWMIIAFLLVMEGTVMAKMTKKDVITLSKLHISAAEIIKAIKKDKAVFYLTPADIKKLERSGVPARVIKFMLKTPKLFGKKRVKKTKPAVSQKSEAQIKAQQEAQKRKMEELRRRRLEIQRKMMARTITKRGIELAEEGNWPEAIKLFREFLKSGGYGPNTPEYYEALYGMGIAFAKGGMAQSAARVLMDVLLMGPDKPHFQDAFLEFRRVRKKIEFSPATMDRLATFDISMYPQDFKDQYYYVLGVYYANYGNYQMALKYFNAVSRKSPDKPKALYIQGVIQVKEKLYRSASHSFEDAISLTEELSHNPKIKDRLAPEVVDLSYLALARLAYESENYDAAIYYYRKVPPRSLSKATAFYELAWTYMMKLDYSRALGMFHALHSPYFKRSFYPDLWIMEARVFTDLCHTKEASAALDEFERRVAVLEPKIKNFINAQRSPGDFYENFKKAAAMSPKDAPLPQRVIYRVISTLSFRNVYNTLKEIDREMRLIKAHSKELGSFGLDMLRKLKTLREDKVNEAGILIQRSLREIDNAINQAIMHETEIQVDLTQAKSMEVEREMERLAGGQVARKKPQVKARSQVIIGSDQEVWKFRGDYWFDELPYYRGMVEDKCQE